MKEKLPIIAGGLLGFVFVFFGLNFFFGWLELPTPPEGTPPYLFFGAIGPTGFLAFVKVLEIAGGVLVAIPRTRNFGLILLTPIVVSIIAFHVFLAGTGFTDPAVIVITVLNVYLLASAKDKLVGLLN